MIIILVGPDGAGKTTLAKRLAAGGSFKIIHRDKPKNEDDLKRMFHEYALQATFFADENVIYDRYIYCEQVYGPIMREDCCVTDAEVRMLEDYLAKNGAMIIHCTGSTDDLWERCSKRGEDYITSKDTLEAIRKGYYDVLSRSKLPVVTYKIE